MASDEQADRRRGPAVTTMFAWAATVFLMFRQISSGFDSGWFSVAVVVAFAAASALLIRELVAARPPR
jgi:hypothetical protein